MAALPEKILEQRDINTVWKNCLTTIKNNVSTIAFNTWFEPIKPISINNNVIKISVPSNFFVEWIDEHYNALINKMLSENLGAEGKLIYVISNEAVDFSDSENNTVDVNTANTTNTDFSNNEFVDNRLNSKYTFENFVKGEGNQLARAAGIAISENPGSTSFNPFFIYGGVGLGKTHLIQAIGNTIIEKFPNKRAIYISADSFTVEFIEAIQSNKINEFARLYKQMDVLIIDDIQFLVGREKTQDLFFQIFNILHQSGKQIILTSDKPPKDLKGLNERLMSRFQWGLSADIQPPDFETRVAILNKKSKSIGIDLPNEIIEYLALNITSNIRELEGCLISLLANHSLNSTEINLDLAKKTVKEISTGKQTNVSIEFITKEVCSFFNIEENSLREKNRKKEIVAARQIAMYLSKKLTKSSLKTIGLHFGGRDHSTVIHAFNTIKKSMLTDMSLKTNVENIQNKIELSTS